MKPTIKVVCFVVFSLMLVPLQAQFGKIIQKATEKTIKDRVNKKIDEETNKAMDRILDSLDLFGEDSPFFPTMGGKILSGESILSDYDLLEKYSFEANFLQHIEGQGDVVKQKSHFQSSGDFYAISLINEDDLEYITLIDLKKNVSIMLMPDTKQYIALSMKGMDDTKTIENNEAENKMDDALADIKITQTDNYKTILGYPCRQVLMESPHGLIDSWVTKEKIKFNGKEIPSVYGMMFQGLKTGNSKDYNFEGLALDTIFTDKESHEETKIKVVDIDFETYVIDTKGYQNISMK